MKKFKEILLVEDEELFKIIIPIYIDKMGIADKVVCKSNGKEALAFLKSTCLIDDKLTVDDCSDVILLDINMPVMNGFEFLQALRELNAELIIRSRVVVLSSSIDFKDRKLAEDFGVKGYIQKPLTMEKLKSVLF